jgi:hypothetical protein
MNMTALRRLAVTVSRSVAPLGNAQGPLSVAALANANVAAGTDVFGVAQLPCANLKPDGVTVRADGFVIGKGPIHLLTVLDDFGDGTPGIPNGALTAIDQDAGTPKVPAAGKVTYAADAYSVFHTMALTTVIPRAGGGGDLVSCP